MKQKFSAEAFWHKTKHVAKKAGHLVIYSGLLLFYVLKKPEVPKRTKATIIGALAYFIAPVDAIPDILAGIGYTDDLGVLSIALVQAAMYIDDDVKEQARTKLAGWFGDDVDTSEIDQKLKLKH
ncbi:YkvA family protein [Ectobacillus panaciterrae]|uniref:YkvA family protein n=1 Tax=Ectobacillus panaciterrae TaxID=363872 RepID=UPI0004189777|nr:YkvA family protein [Ectobacillus panaciterrae]